MGEEPHIMKAGDFEMMTAGSGVVHTETISSQTKMRLLQLWLNLPKSERHASPRIQKLKSEHVPHSSIDGVSVRVYSGSFGGLTSPVRNHTPLTIADISMKSNASVLESIPAHFTVFLYVIDGSVRIGEEEKVISKTEVGWLDRHTDAVASELLLKAGDEGARFVLYAAEPQLHEIVAHGPFIADTMDEIKELYADFRQGKMEHISAVPEEQKLVY
jgi:redox-sensitive bicupin YhaK (pirin superfamily)